MTRKVGDKPRHYGVESRRKTQVEARQGQTMESKLLWDLLPEEFPYQDEGCELFPSCLNCPFPNCLEEEPWGKERFLKVKRAQRMLELRREGKSVKDIARIFEVSTRTVQRWLKVVASQESKVGTVEDGDCHAPTGRGSQ